jgi:CheY-like chemotaxis protein/helix-turn-helix protein
LDESIITDFEAKVELHGDDESPRQMRVMLSDQRIVFAASDSTHSILASDVFDVVQDVSARATAATIETVTLAYRVGEVRKSASIRGNTASLFRFQKNLFRILLDGTSAVLRHTEGGSTVSKSPTSVSLSVTGTHIRAIDDGAEPRLVIPRRELTAFKTGKDSVDGEQHPIISLYWTCNKNPAKTVIRLRSLRLFNLFGRYIQSTLRLETDEEKERQQSVDILLVDDDPDDLEMGTLFLNQQSDRFSITCTASAAEGLEHLAQDTGFDCVVSDFSMPGMNGIEFLREVRQQYPYLPFILYTGQGSKQVAKRAIIDDVTDYVKKNIGTNQYAVLADRIWKAVD